MSLSRHIIYGNKTDVNSHINKFVKPKSIQEIFVGYIKQIYPFSYSKIDRITDCGSYISFYADKEESMHVLKDGNFCKDRLCPVCSYRLARKNAYKLAELLAVIRGLYDYKFLFATFTSPNVPGVFLSHEITSYQKAFEKIRRNKIFERINKGFVRKLEITYNPKTRMYHPHYHVVIAVNKSYFSDPKSYIPRDKWLEMWKTAKMDSSITQVDIRKADLSDVRKIYELATYSAKLKDMLDNGKEVFEEFYKSLRNRRIITYNGVFKDIKAKLESGEIDLADIDGLSEKKIELDRILKYEWNHDEYIQKSIEELPEEERPKYYKFEID